MTRPKININYGPKDRAKLEKYPILQTMSGRRFCKICKRRFRLRAGFDNNCKHCGGKQ
jgi:hypothetical protein